jgi:hypothetical protein
LCALGAFFGSRGLLAVFGVVEVFLVRGMVEEREEECKCVTV